MTLPEQPAASFRGVEQMALEIVRKRERHAKRVLLILVAFTAFGLIASFKHDEEVEDYARFLVIFGVMIAGAYTLAVVNGHNSNGIVPEYRRFNRIAYGLIIGIGGTVLGVSQIVDGISNATNPANLLEGGTDTLDGVVDVAFGTVMIASALASMRDAEVIEAYFDLRDRAALGGYQ